MRMRTKTWSVRMATLFLLLGASSSILTRIWWSGGGDGSGSAVAWIGEGALDEDIAPSDTVPITNSAPNSLQGPITRARTRHLNSEVCLFLMLHTNINEDGMLLKSCDVLLLRNMGSAQFTSNELWCTQSTRATSSFYTPFTSSQPPLKPTSSSTPSLRSSNKRYMQKTELTHDKYSNFT